MEALVLLVMRMQVAKGDLSMRTVGLSGIARADIADMGRRDAQVGARGPTSRPIGHAKLRSAR